MRRDRRGTVAFEFCLAALPFFVTVFIIFDLARYGMTQTSLRMLATAGARAMMVNCYSGKVVQNQSPSSCTGDPLPSDAAKQAVAPLLYLGGLTPTLSVSASGGVLTVTATSPGFSMIMPIWGTSLNKPSVSTWVPY
jgi:hypothetical protein